MQNKKSWSWQANLYLEEIPENPDGLFYKKQNKARMGLIKGSHGEVCNA